MRSSSHRPDKSEAKYGGHGGSTLRRFQSPCAIFTIHVNMKDRVGRLRRRKLGPPYLASLGDLKISLQIYIELTGPELEVSAKHSLGEIEALLKQQREEDKGLQQKSWN